MSLVAGCSDASWISEASNELKIVQEERADSLIKIGLYYQQKYEKSESTSNRGAITRYREVVEKYPNYSRIDYALLLLGNAYLSSSQLEDAFAIYTRLINEFPASVYVQDGFKQLDVLAKKSIESTRVK